MHPYPVEQSPSFLLTDGLWIGSYVELRNSCHSSSLFKKILVMEKPQWKALEDDVMHGNLKCGIEYYIRSNKKPVNRTELRMVIKVRLLPVFSFVLTALIAIIRGGINL
jgi:hypothetical protein